MRRVFHLTCACKKGEFFSMAVSSDGSYGVEKDLMFSYPLSSNGDVWEIVQGIEHNDFAKEKIAVTTQELRDEKAMVEDLLG
ncbi:hypothetical protein IH799_01385 [candidate division KSB1 bacterium]|nr:hypothetical protein [candidate division KSB1 bacterium]